MILNKGITGPEVINIFISSFDSELVRLTKTESVAINVIEKITNIALTINPYGFFNAIIIKDITEKILEDKDFLQFLFNVTIKTKTTLSLNDVSEQDVINLLKESICNSVGNKSKESLLPRQIAQFTSVDEDFYTEVSSNNFWLIVLFVVVLFFQDTSIWSTLDNPSVV